MKISYDKWYPVVQPNPPMQSEVFAKRVERLNAERAVQVQIDQQVKKFHHDATKWINETIQTKEDMKKYGFNKSQLEKIQPTLFT